MPIGVYLSGIIDSSAIAGLATHLSEELDTDIGSILSTDHVTCFCVEFDKMSGFNESSVSVFARNVALVILAGGQSPRHCAKDDRAPRGQAVPAAYGRGSAENATWHCEHHNRNLNYVGKFTLSELPRQLGFEVLLTGEGVDEIFTGYREFIPDILRKADLTWASELPEDKQLHLLGKAEAETAGWHGLVGADGAI
jgi:asparagine synthase (glutamine-hydrolysing)